MKINVFTLTSPVHDPKAVENATDRFLQSVQDAGLSFSFCDTQYADYGTGDLDLIFVRTGGTEGEFLRLIEQHPRVLSSKVCLLASGESNSLAASVEILSWLQQNGYAGEILHGKSEYIAHRASALAKVGEARRALQGKRAGIIGTPSDWLIASQADQQQVKDTLGISLVNIPMAELIREIEQSGNVECSAISLQPCQSTYFSGAMAIYRALRNIIKRYSLNALTLRCFDLLSSVRNTGCLALAMLNAEGIPAACEGDVPALLTMMTAHALTRQTGFQANPSRINPDTGEVLFAHCTVPLNMVSKYTYDTHFESGIGVALHGEIPEGDATLFKMSGDGKRYFAEDVQLLRNGYENNLCRTQVTLQTTAAAPYLLHHPIGNHHIILTGHHSAIINTFMDELR